MAAFRPACRQMPWFAAPMTFAAQAFGLLTFVLPRGSVRYMRISFTAFWLLVSAVAFAAGTHASTARFVHLTGHYSDEDLVKGAAPKLLPMTFLLEAKAAARAARN